MGDKKPDIVVWGEENGYDAKFKLYPTNLGSPGFDLPNMGLVKTESSKKMIEVNKVIELISSRRVKIVVESN